METVNDTAMHVTETKTLCSSLTCPKSKSEEITREKEEELLYGSIEDGDEEDALSDDSIRLRVSDDEADLDEPSASTNMNNDKADRRGLTNTEVASAIPSRNTLERKNGELSREKLSNGICTFEKNVSSRVSEEENFANDDFSSDVLPKTNDFFGVTENADDRNGDIDREDKTKFSHGGSRERSQANRNPMIDYLRRGNHNSLPRQSHTLSSRFATNSYNDRYYNKKYYGGGKGSGRGYNGHSRDSFSHEIDMDSKYTPRVFPSDNLQKGNDTRNASPTNINIKDNDKDTSCNNQADKIAEIGKTDSNDFAQSESIDFVKNREAIREDKNEFSKIDNAEAANNSLDSKDSTSVNNQTNETNNLDEFTADQSLNSQKNEVNVKCEANVGNVSVASDETFVADEANDIAENLGNDKNESFNEIEPKIGEDTPKSVSESTNSTLNPDKILEENDKDEALNKSDEFTDSVPIVTETFEDLKTNETSDQRGEKVVETTEVQTANEENEAKTIEESEANILDEKKIGADEKSVIVCQSKVTTEKQLIEAESQKTIEDSVVTESKTIEKSVEASNAESLSVPKISEIEHSIADLPDEKETSSDEEGEGNNVTVVHSSLKRSRRSLDEMELSKRMRRQRKKSIDTNDRLESKDNEEEPAALKDNVAKEEKTEAEDGSNINTARNTIGELKSDLEKETSVTSSNVVASSSCANKIDENHKEGEDESGVDANIPNTKVDDCEVIEVPVKLKPKRSRRSVKESRDSGVNQEDTQEKENVRQKRRTARNAEEIIRKEFLGNSDSESNDSAGKFVAVNYNRTSNDARAASPPSLKRNLTDDDEEKIEPKCVKKLKPDFDANGDAAKSETLTRDDNVSLQTLHHVRHFFRRDSNGKLAKLKQEELEELLIQKVVETITMRDEIGKLREQAKISEQNQEKTRLKYQQLSKQIKDFEMVLNRYNNDRRSNPDKSHIVPIKINRSVGLQVNFVTDHGIQNLRQLGQTQKASTPTVNGVVIPQRNEQSTNPNPVIKRTVKVRSPRRPEPIAPASTAVPTALPSPVHNQPIISNITPAALVVAKSVQETRTSVTTAVQQANVSQLMASNQTILVNGLPNAPIRQTSMQVSKTKNKSDLIDLTQEEDKTKTTVISQNAILTTPLTEAPANVTAVSNIGQRYHTVIQTIPGSVAITAPTGIRVVQPSSQPTPTALVNNMNAPRLAYVMQSGIGGQRQVLFTSTPTPIRPAPDHQNRPIRTTFPISGTITNGTVRVIPTSSTATLQVCKHPAALPESINPPSNVAWKLPPPAPSLKISKVANGIVLSWNMALSDKFADIASYQLYAYQEVAGIPPSSTLWKKVGDVRALPLPMACTLTQFSEGNNYYFAVRAVDRHSRLGMYSQPGNISL